ncbi:hypothetical protein R3P38DRAFT_2801031 [Favolaschia claudopus]|uniref:DUF6535 domain-containing protein n=1 Tax=Favolaschia claudopus TaxID=2862362 RepID=A0AAV9ZWC9_9AGAR
MSALNAGLFSAVLTAFLIESYKTLNPDSDDLTVLLLTRISEQLAASANGNASNIPRPLELTDRGPTSAALACNTLWFLSLGLSLSCALIATLLEQWAREFLHRTDIHSAPVIRARMFSFLYYGLRRFNMHTIVDIIPLLLHLSLLLFFSGLVAFLVPVNTGITLIAFGMLSVVAITYSVLTVIPLRYLDSPYRTPLTGLFWKLYQYFKIQWSPRPSPSEPADQAAHSEFAGETMVAAISRVAAEASEQRASRDLKALVWTVKSLADDTELEPFVDAVSDILWSPHGLRKAHYDLIRNLVNNPQTVLHARIIDLYRSCDSGILAPAALKRRKIICYKGMWNTIPLLDTTDPRAIIPLEYSLRLDVQWFQEQDLEILRHVCSVAAIVWWKKFEIDKLVLNTQLKYLQRLQVTSGGNGTSDAVHLTQIQRFISELVNRYTQIYDLSRQCLNLDYGTSPDHQIPMLLDNIRRILAMTPHLIFFHYLQSASTVGALPYCFHATIDFIFPTRPPPPAVRGDMDATFDDVIPRLLNIDSAEHVWMDSVMNELMRAWHQQGSSDGLTLHPEFLRYLNNRHSDAAVFVALEPIDPNLFWEVLANTLEATNLNDQTRLRDSLTAAWRLLSGGESFFPGCSLIPRLLDACTGVGIPSVPPSLIAVFKSIYLTWTRRSLCAMDPANALHRWLATIAMSSNSTVACEFSIDHPLNVGRGDACLVLYAEYLEICATSTAGSEFPHNAMRTLKMMNINTIGSFQTHHAHQIRLADALRAFFQSPACAHMRFTVIADTWLFRPYLHPGPGGPPRLLDHPAAQNSVIATLTQYMEEIMASAEADTDRVVLLIRTILFVLRSSSGNDSEGNSAGQEAED